MGWADGVEVMVEQVDETSSEVALCSGAGCSEVEVTILIGRNRSREEGGFWRHRGSRHRRDRMRTGQAVQCGEGWKVRRGGSGTERGW